VSWVGEKTGNRGFSLERRRSILTRPRRSFTTASCAWKGSVWEVGCAGSASTGGDEPGDAPVVICSELPDKPGEPAANIRLLAEQIAGEVVRRHFPTGLPNLPRPLIWIERYLTFEGDPCEFALVDFAFWRPRPVGVETDGRVALGSACRESITGEDVRWLVA
jgi:hypothetical protein